MKQRIKKMCTQEDPGEAEEFLSPVVMREQQTLKAAAKFSPPVSRS
jgi:hypothetical protein